MSDQLFLKLEEKIDQALEVIELTRLQLDDFEEKNAKLIADNGFLKERQAELEKGLNNLLRRLERVDLGANIRPEQKQAVLPELEDALL